MTYEKHTWKHLYHRLFVPDSQFGHNSSATSNRKMHHPAIESSHYSVAKLQQFR